MHFATFRLRESEASNLVLDTLLQALQGVACRHLHVDGQARGARRGECEVHDDPPLQVGVVWQAPLVAAVQITGSRLEHLQDLRPRCGPWTTNPQCPTNLDAGSLCLRATLERTRCVHPRRPLLHLASRIHLVTAPCQRSHLGGHSVHPRALRYHPPPFASSCSLWSEARAGQQAPLSLTLDLGLLHDRGRLWQPTLGSRGCGRRAGRHRRSSRDTLRWWVNGLRNGRGRAGCDRHSHDQQTGTSCERDHTPKSYFLRISCS